MNRILSNLRQSWRSLVLADLLFKVTAFVVLVPLVSLVFRLFITLSGRQILADADIAKFLIHPIGWIALLVVGGASLGIVMLEQAVLMTIAIGREQGQTVGVRSSVLFVCRKTHGVFRIATSMVQRVTVLALPFLLAGGVTYYFLLTDHDINYYLQTKPPKYWIAGGLIGLILGAMTIVCVRSVLRWLLALPIHLFENTDPRNALKESEATIRMREQRLSGYVVAWAGLNAAFAWMLNGVVVFASRHIVPTTHPSLIALTISIGLVILALLVVNYFANSLAAISFALLLTDVFGSWRTEERIELPSTTNEGDTSAFRVTKSRMIYGSLIALFAATLVGATAIHSIELEDDVEVIAHRGASIRTPENSLASAIAAIDDGADWVEIDVQESSDGVVIVAHDSDLKKLGGGPEKIWEMTAEDLRLVDIGSHFSADYSDQGVPTLDEILKACRGKIRVLIELKYYGHDQDLERRVIHAVEENEMAEQVAFMSLKADKVKKFKQIRPDWDAGLLTAVAIGGLQKADADFLAVNTNLATRAFIQSAHREGKKVCVWTVNDRSTMSLMISRGVDSLITDDPALARTVIQERAMMSPVERLLISLGERSGIVTARSTDQ